MATNCSARGKITQHFELKAYTNGDQMTYTFLSLPPLTSLHIFALSCSELYAPCVCKVITLSVPHILPFFLNFILWLLNFKSDGCETSS
jgi:hypothetical protein